MMKRIFFALICVMLAASMLLVSCKKDGEGDGDSTTTNADDTTTSADSKNEEPEHPMMDLLAIEDFSQYITLGDYKKLAITLNVGISEEELDKAVEEYAVKYKYYSLITDRATEKGDTLEIKFVGYINGEAFEGGSANKATISLTESTGYIEGFDKDLYGIMPGTTVRTTVVFPKDYNEELGGKTAEFDITVNGICKYGFTDENIAEMTSNDFTTVEAFRENTRKLIILENLEAFEDTLGAQVIEELEKVCKIVKLPEEQVDYYYFDMVAYYKDYYAYYATYLQLYYGITSYEDFLAMSQITDKTLLESAELYAAEDILMVAIAKDLGVNVSEDEYDKGVSDLASEWGFKTVDELLDAYGETYVKLALLKEECMKELKEKYVELTTDYDEHKHLLEEKEETTTSAS